MFMTIILVGAIPYTFFALRKVFGENYIITLIKTLIITYLVITLRHYTISLAYYIAYLTT